MSQLLERHQTALEQAVQAIATRDLCTRYAEVPRGNIYGEGARQQGQDDFQALLEQPFSLPDHPGAALGGHEITPHGLALGIQYPLASADELINAATEAQEIGRAHV